MVKVGRMMPWYQQLCYAHVIQLVVIDTLYKQNNPEVEELLTMYENCEEDEQDNTDDDEVINKKYGLITILDQPSAELVRCN